MRPSTKDARKYLNQRGISLAFMIVAADLEWHFFCKLFCEKNEPLKDIEGKSLGILLGKCIEKGLVKENYLGLLEDFKKFRNKVVHNRLLLKRISNNKEWLAITKNLILEVCDFLDKSEVRLTKKMEKKFLRWDKEKSKEWKDLFNALRSYKNKTTIKITTV